MDKKEIIMLFEKLIEKKLNQFYQEKIKPDIEEMIKNSSKKEDVKPNPMLNDKKIDNTSLLSIMEDDEIEEPEKSKISEHKSFPPMKNKKVPDFNTKNPVLNNILTEMAQDPSKYRIPRDMMGPMVSTDDGTLSFNSSMVGATRNPLNDDKEVSLEEVQEAVAYQAGDSQLASTLIRDYSSVLKKSKEITKSKGV